MPGPDAEHAGAYAGGFPVPCLTLPAASLAGGVTGRAPWKHGHGAVGVAAGDCPPASAAAVDAGGD